MKRFVIVDPGTPVAVNEETGEVSTTGHIGIITERNAYLTAYPKIREGQKRPEDLEINERSKQAGYSLSGTQGWYDIVRVSDAEVTPETKL